MAKEILYYKIEKGSEILANSLENSDSKLELKLFKPTLFNIMPPNYFKFSFLVWWLFWILRILEDKYFIGLVYNQDNKIAHHFIVLPKFFKYPFMAKGDFQIGDVWTSPSYRGLNLSAYAISTILKDILKVDNNSIWYLTTPENYPSIKVAEKLGIPFFNLGYVTNESYFYFFKTNIYKL